MTAPSRLEVARELEWRRIRKDVKYFLNRYWNIEIVGEGYQVSGLRTYQEHEVDIYARACRGEALDHQLRLKARQIGYTTIATGFAFHNAFFFQNHPWLIAQQAEKDAVETLLKKIKTPFLMLPAWIRERGPKLEQETSEILRFGNGSEIAVTHSGASAGRSRAVYGTLMDEVAFIEAADDLFAALDPLTYGLFLAFSTANGMGNWFHDQYLDAQLSDSEWEFGFYPWHVVPGRDEEWYNRTKRKYRTREWLFYQEYPSTPEEAFAKSGRTALPLDTLEQEMCLCRPRARYDITLLDLEFGEGVDIEEQLERAEIKDQFEDRDLELWVWEHPYTERDEKGVLLRQPNFVVGVDVAEGLDDGDSSAVTVFDSNTLEEVCSFVGAIPVEDLGALAEWVGYWYYTALILIERNNQGLVPLQYLSLNQYPRLYRMDSIAARKRGDRSIRYGWHTNRATKPKMVIEFIKALRNSVVLVHDERILKEARTFLADGKGSYGASSGNHDDKLMSLFITYQGCLDVGQYPCVWVDHTQKPLTFDDFFGELLASEQERPLNPLYKPIGQPKHGGEQVKRGFLMHPENFSRQ